MHPAPWLFSRLACLLGMVTAAGAWNLTAAQPGTGGEGVQSVTFRDDFRADTRKKYHYLGGAAWKKGGLELPPFSNVICLQVIGGVGELRVTVEMTAPREKMSGCTLTYQDVNEAKSGIGAVNLMLNQLNGIPKLGFLLPGKKVEKVTPLAQDQGKPGEVFTWEVCLQVRHGLARGKAWPVGTREPEQWQVVHYHPGALTARQAAFMVQVGKFNGLRVTAVDLRGNAQPEKTFPLREREALRLGNQGVADYEAGDFKTAVRHLRGARALWEGLDPDNPNGLIDLLSLGQALEAVGQHEEARVVLQRALRRARVLDPEHFLASRAHHELGALARRTGRYQEAYRHLYQADAINQRILGWHHKDTWRTLNSLAVVHLESGRYSEARVMFEKILAISNKVPGLAEFTGSLWHNLGTTLLKQGNLTESQKILERALEVVRAQSPPNPLQVANVTMSLGTLHLKAARYPEAVRWFEEAHREVNKAPTPTPLLLLEIENNLGYALALVGEHARGRKILAAALAGAQKQFPRGHRLTGFLLVNLGESAELAGDKSEAERRYREGIEVLEKHLGPGHLETCKSLVQLGVLHLALGQQEQALAELLTAHQRFAELSALQLTTSSEPDHQFIKERWFPCVATIFQMVHRNPEVMTKRGAAVLGVVHDWKAASLRTLLRHQEAVLSRKAPAAAPYLEQLQRVNHLLLNARLAGLATPENQDQLRRVGELLKEKERLERDVALLVGDALIKKNLQPPTLADVAEAAKGFGATLVEYLYYHEFEPADPKQPIKPSRPHYGAFVLSPSVDHPAGFTVRFVPLGEAKVIHVAVRDWRKAVQDGTRAEEDRAEKKLRQLVWEPVAGGFGSDVRRVVLAPDGNLALVSFAALREKDGGAFLVERYALSYVSNGRDLVPRPEPAGTPSAPLILADPDYDRGVAKGKSAPDQPAPPVRLSDDFTRQEVRWGKLEMGGKEGRGVKELIDRLRPKWQATLLLGGDAGEEALFKVARPRLLHLVSHGFFLPDLDARPGAAPGGTFEEVGLRSGIVLAGANHWKARVQQGEPPGLLMAAQVRELDLLGTELVVLSACNTGLGTVRVGEGVIGLRTAFHQAGTRTVISSLWLAEDKTAETVMTDFYGAWLGGQGRGDALRKAQLAALRGPVAVTREKLRARYWACWVLSGDPGQLEPTLVADKPAPNPLTVKEGHQDERPPTDGSSVPGSTASLETGVPEWLPSWWPWPAAVLVGVVLVGAGWYWRKSRRA